MQAIELQRSLWRLGFDPRGCDGIMGRNTIAALAEFQRAMGFEVSPELSADVAQGIADRLLSVPPLVLSRYFRPAARPTSAPIDLVVVHTMEHPEKPRTARDVAAWFAGPSSPKASPHYCVDDADTIACVLECDVAWHAPGVNHNGVGIEHAGFAAQTPAQWDDAYSRAVLDRSAHLAAAIARRFDIPIVKLSFDELPRGGRGFVGHVDASRAFHMSDHTDPGDGFPWDDYLALVRGAF